MVIMLPGQGQAIGNRGIRRKLDNGWEADAGYELNPRYWGNAYAAEAARDILGSAYQDLGFKIWG